jgi:DNA-binding response OmpR family regulator
MVIVVEESRDARSAMGAALRDDGHEVIELTDGAQLISVPSNNATFDRSEMTYQQLAMDRVRASARST